MPKPMSQELLDAMAHFANAHPHCMKLGLEPAKSQSGYHPGFDSLEVQQALGAARYSALVGKLTNVFSCGHGHHDETGDFIRHVYPDGAQIGDVPVAGREVHCIYATDLEAFLKAEG